MGVLVGLGLWAWVWEGGGIGRIECVKRVRRSGRARFGGVGTRAEWAWRDGVRFREL